MGGARVFIGGKGSGKQEGRSKGTGIVVFADEETVEKAIQEMNEYNLEGRRLIVKKYIRREDVKLDFSALEGEGDMTFLTDEEEEDSDEDDEDWWKGWEWDEENGWV